MFISSGYSAQTRSSLSAIQRPLRPVPRPTRATQHHHHTADMLRRGRDHLAPGRVQPESGGLVLELSWIQSVEPDQVELTIELAGGAHHLTAPLQHEPVAVLADRGGAA